MAVIGSRMAVVMACVAVMTGCAGRNPASPSTFASTTPVATTPTLTTPTATTPASSTYGSTTPASGLPGQVSTSGSLAYTDPAYSAQSGTVDPTTGLSQPALTARVESKKNGVFLGMGKFKVTVSVTNPASVAQTGTLTTSILDKGKSIKDFTQAVTIEAGQTQTFSYEDSRWKADDASVSVTTTPAATASYY